MATDKPDFRQMVVDKATAKLNDQMARKADQVSKKADKVASHAAKHLESIDRLTAHLEALELWTRAEPGARRPRFTREEIAAVAIRIADEEGFDAVSMRRIAAELDAGTMTLYHYVRTKDELLALMVDTMMQEMIVPPGEMPEDWREAITLLAVRSRDSLLRHPWVLDISDDPNLGPNSVAHFDQTMHCVSSLDLSLIEKLDITTAVDEYVFGYCVHMRTNFRDNDHDPQEAVREYIAELIATGEYKELSAMVQEDGLDTVWEQINAHARDETRFHRNLARLLDGFEADLSRRQK